MRVVPRKEWGAKPATEPLKAIKKPVPLVFIHHEAAVYNRTDEASDLRKARSIQAFHQGKNKYCDIAYSFLVFPSGRVLEGRGWAKRGGHTGGKKTPHINENEVSHGICFVGHFDKQQPTKLALGAAAALIREGIDKGFIKAGADVFGHRDVDATACPGKNLHAKLPALRKAVAAPTKRAGSQGRARKTWYYGRTKAGKAIVRSASPDTVWKKVRSRVAAGETISFSREVV